MVILRPQERYMNLKFWNPMMDTAARIVASGSSEMRTAHTNKYLNHFIYIFMWSLYQWARSIFTRGKHSERKFIFRKCLQQSETWTVTSCGFVENDLRCSQFDYSRVTLLFHFEEQLTIGVKLFIYFLLKSKFIHLLWEWHEISPFFFLKGINQLHHKLSCYAAQCATSQSIIDINQLLFSHRIDHRMCSENFLTNSLERIHI